MSNEIDKKPSLVLRSREEDKTDHIRRIPTCLPHLPLETTPYPDRQEHQYAGLITSLKNKPCPTLLMPWTDFPILQQQLFERASEFIPKGAELFISIQFLKELGQELCDGPLASGKDLEGYQRSAVERPTTRTISCLQQIEEARREFNLGGGIIFENHGNTLNDSNEEARESVQNLHIKTKE
jgi:hypothetical protein